MREGPRLLNVPVVGSSVYFSFPSLSLAKFHVHVNTSSPEDKRKIVQIGDTSTKFHTLDPLQVGNDIR